MYMETDYYTLLGVSHTSSVDEIQKSFRQRSLKLHPDKPSGDAELFKKLLAARDVLSDPDKRRSYDKELRGSHSFYTAPNSFSSSPRKPHSSRTSDFDPFYNNYYSSSRSSYHNSRGDPRTSGGSDWNGSRFHNSESADSSFYSRFSGTGHRSFFNDSNNSGRRPGFNRFYEDFYSGYPSSTSTNSRTKPHRAQEADSKRDSHATSGVHERKAEFTRTDDQWRTKGSSYAYVRTEGSPPKTSDPYNSSYAKSGQPRTETRSSNFYPKTEKRSTTEGTSGRHYASSSSDYSNLYNQMHGGTKAEPIIIDESEQEDEDDEIEITAENELPKEDQEDEDENGADQDDENEDEDEDEHEDIADSSNMEDDDASRQNQPPPSPPISPPEHEANEENKHSKRFADAGYGGYPSKKARFDMSDDFKNIPPFTQTNGNFDMSDLSQNIPETQDSTVPKKRRSDRDTSSSFQPKRHTSPSTIFTPVNGMRAKSYFFDPASQTMGSFPDLQDGSSIMHIPVPSKPEPPQNLTDANALANYGASFEDYLIHYNEYRTTITNYFARRTEANQSISMDYFKNAEFVARYLRAINNDRTADSLWRKVNEDHKEVMETYLRVRQQADLMQS